MTMAASGIILYLILRIWLAAGNCYNCPHVNSPDACHDYIQCDPNDACRVTSRVTGNVTSYTMSCHDEIDCKMIVYIYLDHCMRDPSDCNGYKRDVPTTTCDICCNNDMCNHDCEAAKQTIWRKFMDGDFDTSTLTYALSPPWYGISTPPTNPNHPGHLRCVKCESLATTQQECNATELCGDLDMCYMNFDPNLKTYRGGCINEFYCPSTWYPGVGKRFTGCMECCDNGDLCNRNLC